MWPTHPPCGCYLAGTIPNLPPPTVADAAAALRADDLQRALKAEPVRPPTPATLNKLAAGGHVADCIDALKLTAAARGPGDYAATPLDTLLELAKEELKDATTASPKVEEILKSCDLVLEEIGDCLPPAHAQYAVLTAKAQNRRGDCLMLLGRAAAALTAYNVAIQLAPGDAYPVFNRGRAQLALGHPAEAKADFTAAASSRFKQPMARKLALAALAAMEKPQEDKPAAPATPDSAAKPGI